MHTIQPATLNNKELARHIEIEDVRKVPREFLEQAALRFITHVEHNSDFAFRRDAVHYIA